MATKQTEFSDKLDRVLEAGFDISLDKSRIDEFFNARAIQLWGEPAGIYFIGLGHSAGDALKSCVEQVIKHLDSQGDSVQTYSGG